MCNMSSHLNQTQGVYKVADLISIKEVTKKTSLSRTTIWRMIERKEFPAPVVLTEIRKAFVLAEVDQWLAERAAMRGLAA